ncbi:MAG TPA: glycosyltransferase [Nitrospiraceae bacterium]|nr:glycosyltransferase [Nitrospiraceae bacterium]
MTTMKATGVSARRKIMLLTVGLEIGGTEGQVMELACRLDPTRFAIVVCGLKGEGTISQEMRRRGIRVITLGGRGKLDVRVFWRLGRVLMQERPDVIHAFLSPANFACCVMGSLLRIPVLILSYRDLEVWKRWPAILIDRMMVRRAHATTCCSEAVRQFALANFHVQEDRIITIHNGIDVERFTRPRVTSRAKMKLRDDTVVIGTVCRIEEPKKGLSVLLEAMNHLLNSTPPTDCQLVIVGEGPALPRLQRRCVELGISSSVVFAGVHRHVEEVLPLMDLFVMPSLYEGFGISLIEAMAAHRPVVATEVGGIPEVIVHDQSGLVVAPGDHVALAEALMRLMGDSTLAKKLADGGQARVQERFSIQAATRRHELLYEHLLARQVPSNFENSPVTKKTDPVIEMR